MAKANFMNLNLLCRLAFCLILLGCKSEQKASVDATPTPDPDIVSIGPFVVDHAWHYINDDNSEGAPTGQYQLTTPDGVMYVLQFCDPIPVLNQGKSYSGIKFHKAKECFEFISAQQ